MLKRMKFLIGTGAILLALVCGAEQLPLKVEGNKLMTGDREIILRGINWGWWHLEGTVYTEGDMKRQAEWGANMLRLAITYTDVADSDGNWNEENCAKVDEVIRWAEKYGQYVILDMHAVPGGQNIAKYIDGGKNRIWTNTSDQEKYFNLWRKLAERYRGNPVVAAYELMNEPGTQGHPERLADLNRRAIAEIRKVDPDKVIVVAGDVWSHARNMTDMVKVDDPNILYTFHFYEGDFAHKIWKGNIGEDARSLAGTSDWQRFDLDFEVPADVTGYSILLRSNDNTGTVWFDDVTLTDSSGKVIETYSFDQNARPFQFNRDKFGKASYDTQTGHAGPGSLKIGETTSYNGWESSPRNIQPGKYRVSGWMKLEKATGKNFIAVALFANQLLTKEELRQAMQPAVDFAKKFNVPMWVGEFSVARNAGPEGYQAGTMADRIALFEENNFHWTYWNYLETTGPDGMALQAQKREGGIHPVNAPLLDVLKKGWQANRPLK